MLVRSLKQRQNALAPDFVGPLHWEFGDALETKLLTRSGAFEIRFIAPKGISWDDKETLHTVIIKNLSTSGN